MQKRIDQSKIDKIVDLHRQGNSGMQISRIMGIGQSTVSKYIRIDKTGSKKSPKMKKFKKSFMDVPLIPASGSVNTGKVAIMILGYDQIGPALKGFFNANS